MVRIRRIDILEERFRLLRTLLSSGQALGNEGPRLILHGDRLTFADTSLLDQRRAPTHNGVPCLPVSHLFGSSVDGSLAFAVAMPAIGGRCL